MNVCALDVITRNADFEAVASTLELRGWEWDFLHSVDGDASLGDVARRTGLSVDDAIGFVHEAMHRGLVHVATMTLETYRLRLPTQTALRGSSPALSLGTSAVADPPAELAAVAPKSGAISFSSDAFDWNAPEASFDEPAEADDANDLALAHEAGAVHYDDRFGVEHPGGPFAITHQHDDDAAFAVSAHHEDPIVEADHGRDVSFSVTAGHDVEALPAPTHFDEPFAPMSIEPTSHETTHANQLDDPFAISVHHDEPASDPFAVSTHHEAPAFEPSAAIDDPFAISAHHDEAPAVAEAELGHFEPFAEAPNENGKAHTNGSSQNGHTPLRFEELFANGTHEPTHEALAFDEADTEHHFVDAHDEAEPPHQVEAAEPEHVEFPSEEPANDSTPGSISFSFSADDPSDSQESYDAPSVREAPEVWTPPTAPMHAMPEPPRAEIPPAAKAETAVAAKPEPAVDPRLSQTQSLFFEREAIDTDAGRELEAKVKNWKDSLSWREQQELNEASASGSEKSGVIGSLLRALGVR